MNELQRMQYLDAMGIEQFVPRKVLANSAALRLCELPVLPQENVQELVEPVQDERPLPDAAEVVNRLLEKAKDQQPEKSLARPSQLIEEQTESPEAVAVKEPQIRFSLAIWQLQNGVMVIDSHEPRSALPTDKLLANMLTVSQLLNLNLPAAGFISWPIDRGVQTEGGWRAAREYLESFIDAAMQKQPMSQFLVFGEAALNALVVEEEALNIQYGQGFTLEKFSAAAVFFPSLVTLLRHPEYKALVWRGLIRKGNAIR